MFRSDRHERWRSDPGRIQREAVSRGRPEGCEVSPRVENHSPSQPGAPDTDRTAGLITKDRLLKTTYAPAERGTNLDTTPERGAPMAIGFAKLKGGSAGEARYIAICRPDRQHGATIQDAPGAPPSGTGPCRAARRERGPSPDHSRIGRIVVL